MVYYGNKRKWSAEMCYNLYIKLENIMLSERSWLQGPHSIWFYLKEISTSGESTETASRLVVAYSWESGGNGRVTVLDMWFLSGVMKTIWNQWWRLHHFTNTMKASELHSLLNYYKNKKEKTKTPKRLEKKPGHYPSFLFHWFVKQILVGVAR